MGRNRIMGDIFPEEDFVVSGALAPSYNVTPQYIGQIYTDSRTGKVYTATGLTNTSWKLISQNPAGFGKMKAIILGDSITSIMGNYDTGPTTYIWAETRWFNVMQWKLGYPFIHNQTYDYTAAARIGHNAGINGDTTTQMLARLEADVLAKSPDIVFFMGGTNDLASSATTSQSVIDNIVQIMERVLASGSMFVYIPILPRNATADWPTANNRKKHLRVNNEMKQRIRQKKGAFFLDMAKIVTDFTTGELATAMSGDGLHPNTWAGWKMGTYAATEVGTWLGIANDNGLVNPTDNYDATDNLLGNLVNGDFSGTGGTKTGSQVSGTVPDSWILEQSGSPTSSVAAAIIARGDGEIGDAVEFTFTCTGSGGSTAEEFLFRTASSSTGVVAGEWYQLEADLEIKASTNGSNPYLGFSFYLYDPVNGKFSNVGSSPSATSKIPEGATGILKVRTPPMKALAGASLSARLYQKVNNQSRVGGDVVKTVLSRLKMYRLAVAPDFN